METTLYMESSAPPCQVDELIATMRPIKRHPGGYRGIHMHFSLLDRHHKQPYHRRSIATAFNKLIQNKSGKLFWTSHFDVIFICKDCTISQLDSAILAALRAVEDSPLIQEYKEAGRDDALYDWYDLETEMDQFMKMIEGLKNPVGKIQPSAPTLKSMISSLKKTLFEPEYTPTPDPKPVENTTPLYRPIVKKETVAPMGPMQLDQLERNLTNMEMDRMMAKQTAYVIVGDSKPHPIFVEHYISVAEIKKNLLPSYDMHADKWLFQRLTRTFDTKLLQALPEKHMTPNQVISININVETVLTPEFDKFIVNFRRRNNQPLILEMRLFDVVSDIQTYYVVKEKLDRLGCRTTLDAMDMQALVVMDRELLEVDFLKINWKPDYRNLLNGPIGDKIISAINAQGHRRVILCHCDTEEALAFGNSIGIHMYQGFLIDKKYGA